MNTDKSFVTILDPNMSSGIHARQRHAWLRGGLLRPGKCILAVLLAWSFGGRTSAASFQGLGDLPGGTFASWACGVSADGKVAVGQGTSASGRQAFRWTAETGIVGLGDLPGGGTSSDASAVSADGTVIVGGSSSSNGFEACRWTLETGMAGLGERTFALPRWMASGCRSKWT